MSAATRPRKRIAHRLKRAWYGRVALDAWTDARLGTLLYPLFPERRLRETPFGEPPATESGLVRLLTLIPPEDTGGGSRPAQIAAELRRRGFRIEWRWALPIYPWPRLRRPAVPGVDVRHVDDPPGPPQTADLVLLEAPHRRLLDLARSGARRGPLVYDSIDLWDGALGAGWYTREGEDQAIAEADHLIASARLLRSELAQRSGRPVELLPNAIDLAHFGPSASPSEPLARGTPTVVYVGALWGEWVDLELVALLAARCPSAAIHLIGPSGDRAIPSAANIHVHGPRPRATIPSLLASADVAIVPFAPSRLAAAVSPLKVFEYLAMQRPVVSTRLPDVEDIPGVTVVEDADGFVSAVQKAARDPFPSEAVRAFLEGHTWTRRVDRLLELTRSARG